MTVMPTVSSAVLNQKLISVFEKEYQIQSDYGQIVPPTSPGVSSDSMEPYFRVHFVPADAGSLSEDLPTAVSLNYTSDTQEPRSASQSGMQTDGCLTFVIVLTNENFANLVHATSDSLGVALPSMFDGLLVDIY